MVQISRHIVTMSHLKISNVYDMMVFGYGDLGRELAYNENDIHNLGKKPVKILMEYILSWSAFRVASYDLLYYIDLFLNLSFF